MAATIRLATRAIEPERKLLRGEMHCEAEVAPGSGVTRPPWQGMQDVARRASLYCPTGHWGQKLLPEFAAIVPSPQLVQLPIVADREEKVPGSHFKQITEEEASAEWRDKLST